MTRYLVLEIDDNEVAGDLLQAIVEGRELYYYQRQTPLNTGDDEWRVEKVVARVKGLFGKPVNFCDCHPQGIFVKGQKFGWFVCRSCGKSRRGWQFPDNLLQEKQPSRVDFVRKQMMRLGFIEGLDKNPEEDWVKTTSNAFRGKHS